MTNKLVYLSHLNTCLKKLGVSTQCCCSPEKLISIDTSINTIRLFLERKFKIKRKLRIWDHFFFIKLTYFDVFRNNAICNIKIAICHMWRIANGLDNSALYLKFIYSVQCPPLNGITLGRHKRDYNNRMIQLTDVICALFIYNWADIIWL